MIKVAGCMQIKLDSRLQAAADLVIPGQPMADIGSDHGLLPAYLVSQEICPCAIATDLSAPSCEKTAALLKARQLETLVDVRQGNGLSVLSPEEAVTVVICGMGGMLMLEILTAAAPVLASTKRLVLQPQKDIPAVRLWLAAHGWRIRQEKMIQERAFYYTLIAAEHGEMTLTNAEAEFGPCLLKERSQCFFAWLNFRQKGVTGLLAQLADIQTPEAEQRRQRLMQEQQKLAVLLESSEISHKEPRIC